MGNFPIMPEQASENAKQVDYLFWTISGLTVIFTIIVMMLVLFFVIKYRRGTKASRKNPMSHNTMLEVIWTGIPLILALGMFVWSARGFIKHRTMPEEAMDVFVIGKQWMWHSQHMDGVRENNALHVPVGKAVTMTMISQDVIHSMYLPEFRAQFHVVPGRYTQLTFTPTKPGRYRMLCAMHCGAQHSEMTGWIYVMEPEDFAEWQAQAMDQMRPRSQTLVERGHDLFELKRCGSCHESEDTVRAPSLEGIMGRERTLASGAVITADQDYIRNSILDPNSQIVGNYENLMPAYGSFTNEEDIMALIAYIKSIGGDSDNVIVPNSPMSRSGRESHPSAADNATDIANRQESGMAPSNAEEAYRP